MSLAERVASDCMKAWCVSLRDSTVFRIKSRLSCCVSGARELGSLVMEASRRASVIGGLEGSVLWESFVAWTAASLEFPPAAIR